MLMADHTCTWQVTTSKLLSIEALEFLPKQLEQRGPPVGRRLHVRCATLAQVCARKIADTCRALTVALPLPALRESDCPQVVFDEAA